MKVSIIVPIYNKEEYLEQCLDSLVSQTYSEIEIILVDDGSKDKSGEICDIYAQKDSRICVIHKENSGAAGAWRAGFARATGRYVMFVDADDWIDCDTVSKMITYATDRDDEIILSDYVIERDNGKKTYIYQSLAPGEYYRDELTETIIPSMWGYEERRICMSRCMKLFSAKLVKENEHYSRTGLRFGEDNALTLPCVMDAGRIYVMDHEAMYHYRYVTNSVVHGYDATLLDSISLLQKLTENMICDKFGDAEYGNNLKTLIWKEWPYLLMYALKNEVRGNKDGYIKNIQKICRDDFNKKIIAETKIEVKQKANILLYFVMKHPLSINCRILRLAMNLHG